MNIIAPLAALLAPLAALLALAAVPASAATASRNFGVNGFDEVRVIGPYSVSVTTGVAPFARASGSAAGIDKVAMRVEGKTLIIGEDHSNSSGQSAGPVTIAVGTHELSRASVNGVGSIAIDRARGLSFGLSVAGAGQGAIANVDVDQFRLAMDGSGSVKLSGRAPMLTAVIRGAGTVEASGLSVKGLTVTAEGPAVVAVTATGTAKVTAGGTSTVTLSGSPSCTLKTVGSATVSGCR